MKELNELLKEQKKIRKLGNMLALCEINKKIFAVREELKKKEIKQREKARDERLEKLIEKQLIKEL